MNCPVCSKVCNEEIYEGVTIDVCSKCFGIWLDQGELEQITAKREVIFKPSEVEAVNKLCGASDVGKEQESRQLTCPKCDEKPMKTINFNYSSGIIIDRCQKGCGLWLDADELDKVQIHAELWQDKLEVNRDRFSRLASQVEGDARKTVEDINNAIAPSRFRFVNSMIRGAG